MSFLTSDNAATIFLPANYVSGTNIAGTMTIPSQSISSTGLSPASFAIGDGGSAGAITFQAVPEPTALALAATAAAAVIGSRQIRRRSLGRALGSA